MQTLAPAEPWSDGGFATQWLDHARCRKLYKPGLWPRSIEDDTRYLTECLQGWRSTILTALVAVQFVTQQMGGELRDPNVGLLQLGLASVKCFTMMYKGLPATSGHGPWVG